MIIGSTALFYNYILTDGLGIFFLIWGGLFFFIGLSQAYKETIGSLAWRKKIYIYNTQTLDWYKENYPQYIRSSNNISCCFCKESSIRSYYLKNKTYKVCNYCAKCGEVLFYSDEN